MTPTTVERLVFTAPSAVASDANAAALDVESEMEPVTCLTSVAVVNVKLMLVLVKLIVVVLVNVALIAVVEDV
jgi:hypothetical protein